MRFPEALLLLSGNPDLAARSLPGEMLAFSKPARRRVIGTEAGDARSSLGKPGGCVCVGGASFRPFLQGKGPPVVLGGQRARGRGTRAPNLCAPASMSPLFAAAAEDPTLSRGPRVTTSIRIAGLEGVARPPGVDPRR